MTDVYLAEADARIGQAVAEDLRHRTPGPGHNSRHQFSDHDAGISSECGKRGTKREAHAQSADQYPWRRSRIEFSRKHL